MGAHPGMGIPSFLTRDKERIKEKDEIIKKLIKEKNALLSAQIKLMEKYVPELN